MSTSATSRMPGLTLSVAWGTGPGTAASSWTDETAYLRRFTIRRGRQRELDRFEAGTATFTLNNRTRRFDPEYAAGALFGSLLPMRQIKLVANWNSVDYPLFYGYIDAIPQAYWYDDDSWVDLPCTDGFKLLALAGVKTPWQVEVESDTPQAWYRLGEEYGEIAGDTSGNGYHATYSAPIVSGTTSIIPYVQENGSLQFDGIDDVVRLPAGSVPTTRPVSVELWCRPTDLTISRSLFSAYGSTDPSLFVISHTSSGIIATSLNDKTTGGDATSSTSIFDGQTHHVVVTYDTGSTTPKVYIDGVDVSVAGSAGNPGTTAFDVIYLAANAVGTNTFTGYLDEVAIYASALSSTQVLDHYNAGTAPWDGDTSGGRVGRVLDAISWPASLRDLDDGTSLLGPAQITTAKALDYIQTVAATEAGMLFMTADGKVRLVGRTNMQTETAYNTSNATFGDSTGELDYQDIVTSFDETLIYNSARVSRQGGITQQADDTTSQTSYLIRLIEESGLLMKTDGEAQDRADWRVLRYKDPLFRIDSIRVAPRKDTTNLYPQVLGRELGERIIVKRRPMAGTVISKELHIEAITHTVDASAQSWDTVYSLSPVDPVTNWAIAGAGGTSASQAGNCVASY